MDIIWTFCIHVYYTIQLHYSSSTVFCTLNLFTDATFNPQNLEEVFGSKEIDKWKFLGYLIGDRNSQDDFERFCQNLQGCEQTNTYLMLKEWQEMHPYASWTLLYEALVKMDEKEISKHILKKYLSGLLQI